MDIERTGVAQREFDRWAEDAKMLEEDSERRLEEQKQFLAVEDALSDWDAYLHSLPLGEHEMAVQGLREYLETVIAERDIVQGWGKYESDTPS